MRMDQMPGPGRARCWRVLAAQGPSWGATKGPHTGQVRRMSPTILASVCGPLSHRAAAYPPNTESSFSVATSWSPGRTALYVSRVRVIVECPRRSETILGFTPAAKRRDAHVCRRS